MIRVVLADDHSIVRSGFRMLLESDPEIEVVGEAAEGMQAYNLVAKENPDVLLLDISMPPGQDGLATCQDVVRDCPGTKVIMLTMYAEAEYLRYTLESGASGYVLKNATAEELKQAVHLVNDGEIYVQPSLSNMLNEIKGVSSSDVASISKLTSRELEILRLVARGFTNRQISEQLFLSVKTIESHRSKIYSRLGITTRAEAVDYAIKHKILNL